jgi:hypothetical protein
MRYTANLFMKDDELAKAYKAKIKKIQENNEVGQSYHGSIDGKSIKLSLMNEVKAQYKAVLEAEELLNTNIFTKTDDMFNLRMKIWRYAKEHMLYDGKEGNKLDDEDFTPDFIEQVIILYCTELLFPLFHRSCTKVEQNLRQSLIEFMTESSED